MLEKLEDLLVPVFEVGMPTCRRRAVQELGPCRGARLVSSEFYEERLGSGLGEWVTCADAAEHRAIPVQLQRFRSLGLGSPTPVREFFGPDPGSPGCLLAGI
ncbi:hypothetical protein [Streptomyces sp. NPDC015350]|uniref:hypothetical protein n=1 Tax=Streptomyces sp. NPDC015350 TaxID=3364955 RepID=UPI0036F555C6